MLVGGSSGGFSFTDGGGTVVGGGTGNAGGLVGGGPAESSMASFVGGRLSESSFIVTSGGQPVSAIDTPTTFTGANTASNTGGQSRAEQLITGTVAPTAEEKPLVDAIRAAQQQNATRAAQALGGGSGTGEGNEFEQRVLDLVNAERAKNGVGPLSYNALLDTASTNHNGQQSRTSTMAHEGIGDGTPADRIRGLGWTGSWGENVAVGQTSPEQVVAEWMASPGHRRNILDPAFTKLGVSYMQDVNGRPFWAQTFGS